MRIAVAGATSWGLTLAWLIADRCDRVDVFARSEADAQEPRRTRGANRVDALSLPSNVSVTAPAALDGHDGLIVAVPSPSVRAFVSALSGSPSLPVLSATKGLEPGTNLRMSEVLAGVGFPGVSVLSGPNLADEVAKGLPAAAVVASADASAAAWWQHLLATQSFRTYRAEDVVGVELGGALKNVVAIAAGAAAGLGFGANTMAAIVTRGLAEMTRLGVALGARPDTFRGLAGVGDLTATCFSPLSRNHRFGVLLAKGRAPDAALAEIGRAVEGVNTARIAVELGKRHSVEMPIAQAVVSVLQGEQDVPGAMSELLGRSLKHEGD